MDYEAAREQGEARLRGPRAESAVFDPARGRLIIGLMGGALLELVPSDVQGLERATTAQLAEIQLEPFGLALHFPKLNAPTGMRFVKHLWTESKGDWYEVPALEERR